MGVEGLRYLTPGCGRTEGGYGKVPAVKEGGVPGDGGWYQHPWALSEERFLVSYSWRAPASSSFAIYYVDVWGNKELIHRDPLLECAFPMALRKRVRPPLVPDTVQPDAGYAICHVGDVYRDLPDIEPGAARYLRISERVNWSYDKSPAGELRWVPGNPYFPQFGYWSWAPVRVIGTVPVADDGSAVFKVPTGMAVYFQLLDENHMELRRMRSHIAFQPGEVRGCVGCHESRGAAPLPPPDYRPLGAAAVPVPPPWGDCRILDYEELVQPVLDRRCVRCHGGERTDGGLDFSAARQPDGFVQSYRTMFGLAPGRQTPVDWETAWPVWPGKRQLQDKDWYEALLEHRAPGQLVTVSDRTSPPWRKPVDASISQPKEFGSRRSKLAITLLRDPLHRKEALLSEEEWVALVTWIDANAPYHSTFLQKFTVDGEPLDPPRRVKLDLEPPFASNR